MSNHFSIYSGNQVYCKFDSHACFAGVNSYQKPTFLEYHCAKYNDYGKEDKWYLKFLKRIFKNEFEIVSEDYEKFIFKIKMGPDRWRNLTILTFFRYLDENESDCTKPRPILKTAFKIKGKIKNVFHSLLMAHVLSGDRSYGHYITWTAGALNYSYANVGTFPSLREFIQNLNNPKVSSVNSKLIKSKLSPVEVKKLVAVAKKNLLEGYKLLFPVDKAKK